MAARDVTDINRDNTHELRVLQEAFDDGFDNDIKIAYGNKLKLEDSGGDYIELYASGTSLVIPATASSTRNDTVAFYFGTGSDINMVFDGTKFTILDAQAADDIEIEWGDGTSSFDQQFFFETASNYVYFDASDDQVYFEGVDLRLNDADKLEFGDSDDVVLQWTGSKFTITVAADDTEIEIGNGTNSCDIQIFGNTANDDIVFDASANTLSLDGVDIYMEDADNISFGDSQDVVMQFDATDFTITGASDDLVIKIGNGTNSFDVIWYAETASDLVTFDASAKTITLNGIDLYLDDSDILNFGDDQDVMIRWDATDLDILAAADDSVIKFGNGTESFDIWIYGESANDYIKFDASANQLDLGQDNYGIELNLFGATAGVTVKWDEAGDELDITATVEMQTTNRLQIRDAGIYIYSSADGQLDIVADGSIQLKSTVFLEDANTETLAAGKTLTVADANLQFLDPDGTGRDVTLPAEASSAGLFFIIANAAGGGSEDLTVKDDAAATVLTIANDESGIVFCDGVTWYGMVGANT